MRLSFGLVATSLLFCVPAEAQQQEATDMKLRSAGFKLRLAETPQEIAHLKRVPPRTILARNKDGKRSYIYADPDYCKCILYGNEAALQSFRDMIKPPSQGFLPGVDPDAIGGGSDSNFEMLERDMISDLDGPYGSSILDNPYFD